MTGGPEGSALLPDPPPGRPQSYRGWAAAHARAFLTTAGELHRSPLRTLTVVLLIGVAMALPAGLYLSVERLAGLAQGWDRSAQLTAFLNPELDDTTARTLARELERSVPAISRVRLKTRSEALSELEGLTGLRGITDTFGGANPLPPILVVDTRARLSDPSARPALEALVSELRSRREVDYVQFNAGWLSRLQALLGVCGRAISGAGALLAVGLVLVVGNTIGAAVEKRREEIAISRLFGATDRFIRRPFLYGGALYGFLGAVVAWGVISAVAAWIGPAWGRLAALYPGELTSAAQSLSGSAAAAAALVGGGTCIGLVGAWIAVWRELSAGDR